MTFRAIIFDWDGTLCQTLGLWVSGYHSALLGQGYALSEDQVLRDFLHHHSDLKSLYERLDYDRLLEDAYDFVVANIAHAPLYENAASVLRVLAARGVPMALVSNSARRVLWAGIAAHRLEIRFCSLLSGEDVARIKPDPEPFLTASNGLDCLPQETLVIGDNRGDIQAGKAAGMQTCLFTPPENLKFHDFEDLRRAEPDFEIGDLTQLLAI